MTTVWDGRSDDDRRRHGQNRELVASIGAGLSEELGPWESMMYKMTLI